MAKSGDRLLIANCTFIDNHADQGGAIFIDDDFTQVIIRNCTFEGNRADLGGGGAIYIGGPISTSRRVSLDHCQFTGNSSFSGGGALFIGGNRGAASITSCYFVSNLADRGGAIHTSGRTTIANTAFAGNTATRQSGGRGGAVYQFSCPDSALSLANCTLTNNSSVGPCLSPGIDCGVGGGLYAVACTVGFGTISVSNCILWGNTDDGLPDESAQLLSEADNVDVAYSCIQGLSRFQGNGNIGTNPLLVAPDRNDGDSIPDLRLRANSPCIDAGNNDLLLNGLPNDLNGVPRVVDDPFVVDMGRGTAPIVDMGAYEYQPDCNGNSIPDDDDLAHGSARDCNENGVPDACDLARGSSHDLDGDARPDECGRLGDFDLDGDVDHADSLVFMRCFFGPGRAPLFGECARFDFDNDNDVDLADFVAFQAAFTGAR